MKRNSTFVFLHCKTVNEMYILKFPNGCPLTRHGIALIFRKKHTVLSLYSPFLFLIKFYFFLFSGTPSIIVPYNCVIISRVLPWVIMFDHCEDIMN